MYEKIKEDIVNSLKEKNQLKLQTLRGIKGDVDLEHINKKVEITDELVIDMLSRGIKTRKESVSEFEKGGRDDLISKTNEEIELLIEYLPKQLTLEELNKVMDEAFDKVKPNGLKDMGVVIKELSPLVKGKCDMKEVSNLVKERLTNLE